MSRASLPGFLSGRVLRLTRIAFVALVLGLLSSTLLAPSTSAAEPIAAVTPHGTYVAFGYNSVSPAIFTLQVSATPPNGNYFPNPLVTKMSAANVKSWSPTVESLTPNTTYYYLTVRKVGANVVSETGSFKTLKRVVSVNFWAIKVTDDSDSLGEGELHFNFKVNDAWQYGLAYGEVGVASGGNTYPDRTKVITNAPSWLRLSVQGVDDDCDLGDALCTAGTLVVYDTEHGSSDQADWATANSGTIQLKSGPGEAYSQMFTLTTKSGALKFIVSGSYTVSYVP